MSALDEYKRLCLSQFCIDRQTKIQRESKRMWPTQLRFALELAVDYTHNVRSCRPLELFLYLLM